MSVLKLEWIRQAVNKDFCQPFFFFSPLISKTVEFFLLLFFLSPSSSLSHFISSFTRKTTSGESSFLIVIH